MAQYWYNDSAELNFYDEQKYSDGYNGITRKMNRISRLSNFLEAVKGNPKTHFLVVKCEMRGRTVAMVDCDSLDDIAKATEHLEQKGLGYASFTSSEGKGWVFPGFSFSSFEAAHAAVGSIPGCDARYRKIAKERGYFVVRGECKANQEIPRLINCTTKEPCVSLFVNLLDKHFKSRDFADLLAYRKHKGVFAVRTTSSYEDY